MKLDEYRKKLLEDRKKEVENIDYVTEKLDAKGISSPASATSTEELRLFLEYMEQKNLFNITEKMDPERKKALLLRKFFKMKRNQQVEVFVKLNNDTKRLEGKVSAIGRDFVMITNLKDRTWVSYKVIHSANTPYGIPNYSNSHQHYLYDNDLRHKLVTNFGETVSKKDILKQQFFEETLKTNLKTWQETWVDVTYSNSKTFGKISEVDEKTLKIKRFRNHFEIPIQEISLIETIRIYQIGAKILKSILH
ncbi:hypothetical protein LCL95_08750 [Bacillus timonensis]|nr:hypothetical protein [Bacillus timonensis]